MEKMKILIFFTLFGLMIIGLLTEIPKTITNIIYGVMAAFAVLFLFTNRGRNGLGNIFKKKDK
jgi:hypothetical protein